MTQIKRRLGGRNAENLIRRLSLCSPGQGEGENSQKYDGPSASGGEGPERTQVAIEENYSPRVGIFQAIKIWLNW